MANEEKDVKRVEATEATITGGGIIQKQLAFASDTHDLIFRDTGDTYYKYSPDGGAGVDGSGTANYVPKWSDSDTLTDSVIYETGDSIGMGTTEPLSNVGTAAGDISGTGLHIKGVGASRLVIEGTTATLIQCDSDGAVDDKMMNIFTNSGVTTFRSLNDDASTRISNILSMDLGTGFLGLANSAPANLLHLYVDDTADSETADGCQVIIEQDGTGTAGIQFERTGISNFSIYAGDIEGAHYLVHYDITNDKELMRYGSTGFLINADGLDMDFFLNGTVANLIATDAGNSRVGINKLPTQGTLDVNGDVHCSDVYTAQKIGHQDDANTYYSFDGVDQAQLYIAGSQVYEMTSSSIRFNEDGENIDFYHKADDTNYLLHCDAGTGTAKIGGAATAGAKFEIEQISTTGAVPVLDLDQNDVDEPFVRFDGDGAADDSKNLSDSAFVNFAYIGMVRVEVNDNSDQITDGDYWMPIYSYAA